MAKRYIRDRASHGAYPGPRNKRREKARRQKDTTVCPAYAGGELAILSRSHPRDLVNRGKTVCSKDVNERGGSDVYRVVSRGITGTTKYIQLSTRV